MRTFSAEVIMLTCVVTPTGNAGSERTLSGPFQRLCFHLDLAAVPVAKGRRKTVPHICCHGSSWAVETQGSLSALAPPALNTGAGSQWRDQKLIYMLTRTWCKEVCVCGRRGRGGAVVAEVLCECGCHEQVNGDIDWKLRRMVGESGGSGGGGVVASGPLVVTLRPAFQVFWSPSITLKRFSFF